MASAAVWSQISSTRWISRKWFPRAQGAALFFATSFRPWGNLTGIGVRDRAARLAVIQIAVGRPTLSFEKANPFGQKMVEVPSGEPKRPLAPDPRRDVPMQEVHQPIQPAANVVVGQFGAEDSDTTVDVVADPARRNDAPFVRIGRRDAADRKPVSPMNVGHRQAGRLNPRQHGHVGNLFERLIRSGLFHEDLVGKDQAVDSHPRIVAPRYPPSHLVHPLKCNKRFPFAHPRLLPLDDRPFRPLL